MTDNELTIWEHLDSVIRVLTCKEMGAWLYRRDKRVLEGELEKIKEEVKSINKDWNFNADLCEVLRRIDNRIAELKGEMK